MPLRPHALPAGFIRRGVPKSHRYISRGAATRSRLLGLLLVRERRRAGQRSLTNLVSVIMHEVRRWLRMPDKGSARPTKTTGIRGDQKNAPYPLDRVS
jgi:hypothetical protein